MEFWKRKLVCLQLQGKTCFCLLNYVFWGNDKMIQVDVVPFGWPDSWMEFVKWFVDCIFSHTYTYIYIYYIHICYLNYMYIHIYIYIFICNIYTHTRTSFGAVWSLKHSGPRIHGWFYDFWLLLPGPRAMVWYLRFWCFWKQILLEITG